ncbi:DUF397 domain-containing protein [Streptomyces syringium]|uniref:DUF397 domain-containing protein n=1 Tax=Streptomyces syringium TaxID=76729 RepID=UPI0033E4A9D0
MGGQEIRPLWRRSTFSQGGEGNCVEVAFLHREVWVRDSHAPDRPTISFPRRTWHAFLTELKPPTA